MSTKIHKNIAIWTIGIFAMLFLVDRYYWAQISQWREDQATNIWLGYTQGIFNLPVGLISSRKIPNPNGMPLLGAFLRFLPNLLSVSFFLGVVQMFLILLAGWKAFRGNRRYFLLATLPSLSAVILRSTSVEFWNQDTITLLNIFFIFWAVSYLESGSLWNIPPIVLLIALAPSIYLAGIVNAMIMALLTIGIILYKRPNLNHVWVVAAATLVVVLASVLLTWRPYFHDVSLEQMIQYDQNTILPDPTTLTFKHGDARLLSLPTQFLLNATEKIYIAQALFAFIVFFLVLLTGLSQERSSNKLSWAKNSIVIRVVSLSGLFILLSYMLSPLLGGPNWLRNERSDQTVQFLPLFLLFIFLLPFAIPRNGRKGEIINIFSSIFIGIFVIINMLCGFMIIHDHLHYRGDVLTEADVPLIYKMQVVEFIAKDWRGHSNSNVIPVDYDLGGGRWDNIPQFGKKLAKWYPAPMTMGRSFDYELLRRFGLHNQQEGTQIRSFGDSRYLITYAFMPPPPATSSKVTHYIFGRLRVSVIEK